MEERLRKFVVTVDAGGFTKAARELHISQPALSAAISKLERELHVQLLHRDGRSLELTEAGKLAYAAAKELGVRVDALKAQLAELNHQKISLSIGMIDSVASALFGSSHHVEELEKQASTSIIVNNSRYLLGAVERGDLDAAFTTEHAGPVPRIIEANFLAAEPLVLVCHSSQFEDIGRALDRGQLPHFISYDQASMTFRLIYEALVLQGITPEPKLFSSSPEVMLRLVQLQNGTAVLPYLLVGKLIANGELTMLGAPRPIIIERRVVITHLRGKHLPVRVANISSYIREIFERYSRDAKNVT